MPLLFWHAYDALDISIELLMSLFPEQVFIWKLQHCYFSNAQSSIDIFVMIYGKLLNINNHVLCNVRNTSIFRSMQIILCIKSGSWWLIETKNHISVVMNSCGKWLITACFMYTNFPWKYFDHFGHYEPLWSDIKILVSTYSFI